LIKEAKDHKDRGGPKGNFKPDPKMFRAPYFLKSQTAKIMPPKRLSKLILKTRKLHSTWKQEKGTCFAAAAAPGGFATAVVTFKETEVWEVEESDSIL